MLLVDSLRVAVPAGHRLAAIAGLRAGVLRLGWFSTAGATLVPRAIARFRDRHPEVALELEEADPDECSEQLREGELDLAVVYEFRDDEPLPAELRLLRLLEDRLHMALPPGHRLASRRRISLADLAGETWIQGVRRGPPRRYSPPPAAQRGSSRASPCRPTTRPRGRGSSPPGSASR